MIVCICHGVTDREIKSHVREGACSVAAVAKACGAGTDCGACCGAVRDLVRKTGERRSGGLATLLAPAVAGVP